MSSHLLSDAGELPVGPRLLAVLDVALRARRPVLLEGPTGIGKSELVQQLAHARGLGLVTLDLSLLEPPDLVGLPTMRDGRTEYAVPSLLPREGEGILLLEELNRAERYVQQPALQLLSARRLHQYELPPGWVCFAAINPEEGDYHVTPLDRALRARFLSLRVRADRAAWLAWAQTQGVHPAVLGLAQAHERIFDDVPPRTWTCVSQLLHALRPEEHAQDTLLRDALGGYLPASWVETVLDTRARWLAPLPVDPAKLLAEADRDRALLAALRALLEEGRTDAVDELTARLKGLLQGSELASLAAQNRFRPEALDALLPVLPGDRREQLVEAVARNPVAPPLVGITPLEVLQGYKGSAAERSVLAWTKDPARAWRLPLLVQGLRLFLESYPRVQDLRRDNAPRAQLGHLLGHLGERWGMPLVDTLVRLGITPIRPR